MCSASTAKLNMVLQYRVAPHNFCHLQVHAVKSTSMLGSTCHSKSSSRGDNLLWKEAWVIGRNSNRNLVPPWCNVPVQLKSCTNAVAPWRAALEHEAVFSV